MTAKLIDGKTISADLRGKVSDAVHRLRRDHGFAPGLAVVLVGEDPASQVYVRNKAKQTRGRHASSTSFPGDEPSRSSGADRELNADRRSTASWSSFRCPSRSIRRQGARRHRSGQGRRRLPPGQRRAAGDGRPGLVPCTPIGCLMLPKTGVGDRRAEAVVVGRSNIVGKPVAQLLLGENCTVTIAHSRTRDLPAECRRADIADRRRRAGRRWCGATGSSRAPR